MKHNFMLVAILMFFSVSLFGQADDPVVLSYRRNFVRANMSTKLDLLNDASRITSVNLAPLYIDALNFASGYLPILGNDAQLIEIATTASVKVAQYNDATALPAVQTVFLVFSDTRVRNAALQAIGTLAAGTNADIDYLINWFSLELSASGRKTPAEIKTLVSCAQTLGSIANPNSFSILFSAAISEIDLSVNEAAAEALNRISENYSEKMLAIIESSAIKNKYTAFEISMKNTSLNANSRGRIAEAAFINATEGLSTGVSEDPELSRKLIQGAMQELTALKWSQVSPKVVKYFYQTQGDYKAGRVPLDSLIPVVNCLGAMGTTEAAGALSIFLGLLNSETEEKKTYSEPLLLAVISALGDLGDKTAFDYLLYVGYLDYPETVKKASRDALARLQW